MCRAVVASAVAVVVCNVEIVMVVVSALADMMVTAVVITVALAQVDTTRRRVGVGGWQEEREKED